MTHPPCCVFYVQCDITHLAGPVEMEVSKMQFAIVDFIMVVYFAP